MSKFFLKYVFFLTVFVSCFFSVYAESMNIQSKFAYNAKAGSNVMGYSKKYSSGTLLQRYDTVTSIARKQAADSVRTRIVKIYGISDLYHVEIDLNQDQQNLTITAYNLLGKKVADIHQGGEKAGEGRTYDINTTAIPSGIYICVIQGDNFRFAEKFFVSK